MTKMNNVEYRTHVTKVKNFLNRSGRIPKADDAYASGRALLQYHGKSAPGVGWTASAMRSALQDVGALN